MLRPGPCKHRAHLADKRAFHPQRSSLIKKIAHLRGENSEASPGPKNDRVVTGQFSYRRNRRFLIKLKLGLLCHLFRDQFRHSLDVSFDARVPYAFRNGLSHALHVAVRGIIEDENLSHFWTSLLSAVCRCVVRTTMCPSYQERTAYERSTAADASTAGRTLLRVLCFKQCTSAPTQIPPVFAAKHNGAGSDLVLNDCIAYLRFGRFSNRPFGVKHFQTIHRRMSMLLADSNFI